MQQESQLHEDFPKTDHQGEAQQQYITHINELISEPAGDNVAVAAADYILTSLYQLSSYLFTKKLQTSSDSSQQTFNKNQLSFDSYLDLLSEDLGKFQKIRTMKQVEKGLESVNIESQLLRCYEKVEGIYFEQNYIFDLSYFQLFYIELKNKSQPGQEKVNDQMDKLCQCLDIVEINLFSQIHCKFEEYFKVVANFQYLKESVTIHLIKLKESRSAIGKVRTQFLQKSVNLRRKIVQRQNIEKVMKLIKQIKSIKKLPQVLESILASSLPYESLSLLQDTKSIKETLKELKCLRNTSESVRGMQMLIQNDLTKRYANELYLYLQECHSKEFIHLHDLWTKIETHTCLDKDSSFVLDQLNSSTNSALSDNPQLMEEMELLDNDGVGKSSTLIPRHEGRQYQIAMILIQSYKYVAFSPELTKIKVCNALRLFAKRFEKELLSYLNQVVTNEISNIKQSQKNPDDILQQKEQQQIVCLGKKPSDEQQNIHIDVVEKVSVEFYIKHLGLLNQIFKETISRFLGYLLTLITEYEEEFNSDWNTAAQSQRLKLPQWHKKFKQIFQQECSLLPSIFKIIEQKIKYLLTLKNISNIESLQFYRWITTLKYWQRYFNNLAENHPLLNYHSQGPAQPYIEDLVAIVLENIRKAILTMNLQTLLYDLIQDYVTVFHKNTTNNEIINTLQDDTWQSTEVPLQFSEILQAIFNPEGNVLNSSVTILDSSNSSSKGAINSSREQENSRQEESNPKAKIKLLKNNILICGIRYKVNLSFLVLCESLGEYMKMARILSHVFQKDTQNSYYKRVFSFIYDKLYDLIEVYCLKGKELILDTKALTFGKIKGKSINAKHICLLCNCLSVLQKIAEDMLDEDKVDSLGLNDRRNNTISLLQSTRAQLISKLTTILNNKTEKEINDFLLQDKANSANPQAASKTSNIIITSFLQMVEITDQYLQVEGVKQVLKAAFQTLSQKYLTHLLLKGGKQRADVQVLIQKLKFLRKYFPIEYESLLKQIPQ